MFLQSLPTEIWSRIVSYLYVYLYLYPILSLNFSFCAKFFNDVCKQNKRFQEFRKISSKLVNKGKDIHISLTDILDNFFMIIKEDIEKVTKKGVFLRLRVMISDIVESLSPFRIFCHLFYCKRSFTVVHKCQYCTCFLLILPEPCVI